jgi:UDP-N-acetylglucosamine:LPS N-acetylglucosamine transferase
MTGRAYCAKPEAGTDADERAVARPYRRGWHGRTPVPGIAVARELLARRPDARIVFAGTSRGIEARVVPREGFALEVIRSGGIKGKSMIGRARGAALLPLGLLDSWRLVSAHRPHLVIGVGGFSSGPVVLAAALRGVPTMLLEQNAVPGSRTGCSRLSCRRRQ